MSSVPSSDAELAKLTEAAIGVLAQAGDADDELAELESMPAAAIADEIAAAGRSLGVEADDAARLADAAATPAQAPSVARAVLTELIRDEGLGEELDDAYRRRGDLMAIDPLSISAAALLVLVLRVRRVRISKRAGADIELDPLKPEVVNAVLQHTGGAS
jgi:hypothetical protein